VLDSLIRLTRTLGITAVAQGIETQEQLTALSRMGCALGQGSLLSAPLDPERALKLAQTGAWATTPRN
jgi:EAL domain-containing protein (putative c-di-GMP-specific phosphodiesterase class I)